MKQIIKLAGIFTIAFAAVSCNVDDIDNTIEEKAGIPFQLYASAEAETKTSIDDNMKTTWANQDSISVFHAVAGTDGYINDGKYVSADADSYLFNGTLSESLSEGTEYDWYAIYPYTNAIQTPGEREKGYVYIGGRSDSHQSQSGNNSTAHLCGKNVPLYGKVLNVEGTSVPQIQMHQLASIVRVNVTNTTDLPLTVKSVSFTGTEDIVGAYMVDISGESPKYPIYNTYVSDMATLDVNNGTAINNGDEAASFYIVIKPFTAKADSKIYVAVNGYEKEINITKDTPFAAGKIKTINFNYNHTPSGPEDGQYLLTNADVTYAASCYETGNNLKAYAITIDGSGEVTSSDDAVDVYNLAMTVTRVTTGEYAGMYKIADKNGNYLYAAGGNSSNYLKAKSTLDAASYWSISEGENGSYEIVASKYDGTRNTIRYNSGNSSNLLFSCYESGKQSPVTLVPFSSSAAPNPVISAITDPAEVSKDGGVVIVNYTVNNAVPGKTISASSSETWVNSFDYSVAREISFAVDQNAGSARTCTVTVSYEGAENVTFEVSQAAGATSGGTAKYVKVTSTGNLTDGTYLIVCENQNVAFNGALTTLDAVSNTVAVTINNYEIAYSTALASAAFTFTASDGSFKGTGGKYFGNASNSNALTSSSTALANTVSISDGNADIVSVGGSYLRYNATSGQTRFRYFKSSTYTGQKAIQLYKYVEN